MAKLIPMSEGDYKDYALGNVKSCGHDNLVDSIVLFDIPDGKAMLERVLANAPSSATHWDYIRDCAGDIMRINDKLCDGRWVGINYFKKEFPVAA